MDIEDVKQTLSDFIKESLKGNRQVNDKKDKIIINKVIYEIQNHFVSELKRYDINTKLNEEIKSESILSSFTNSNVQSHLPNYYAYPFLKYICLNFRPSTELNEYIDDFLNKNREQLSWNDLVITKTGATRCKTNIRFALNFLRELNLIRSKNNKEKRTVCPTVLGQLIIMYFHYLNSENKHSMRPEENISMGGLHHFHSHLRTLINPQNFNEFLKYIKKEHNLSNEDSDKLETYLFFFTEIILENMHISDTGLKFDRNFKKEKEYEKLLTLLSKDVIKFDFSSMK